MSSSGAGDGGIDEEILAELFEVLGDGDAEGLIAACNMFLDGVPARFADAESAIAEGRYDEAARVAHSLKGTSGAFGATRLSGLANDLEQACKSSNAGAVKTVLEQSRAEYEAFSLVLGARLPQATGGQ